MPARLFLVATTLHDRLLDGLAIADRGLVRARGDAEAVRQPLGSDAQLHLALPPKHHLMRLGIVDHAYRGVLLQQLRECLAELHVVLALLGHDRNGQHRRMGDDFGDRRMRLWSVAQSVAGLGVIELAECDGIARLSGAAFLGLLTHELENSRDARDLPLCIHQIGTVSNLSGEHADRGHLAAMGGIDGLEHVGDGLARLDAEPLRRLGNAGRLMAQRLHEAQHPVGTRGRAEQHRADQTFAQFLRQIVEYFVARRLDVFEQLLHQLVVVIGQRLEHREPCRLLAVERITFERNNFRRRVLLVDEGALQCEIDETSDDIAGEGRYLSQKQLAPRGGLQDSQHLVDGGISLVDLVEEQKARNLLLFELAQNELKLRHLLFVELAYDNRGVDRRQRRAHVVDEFDRAGTIDESIGVAHEIGAGDGEFDGHFMMTRFLAGVADRVLRIDRALTLDRAGAREDRLEQRRLAALERAHQCDAPWTRGSCAVLCHSPPPIARRYGPFCETV